MKWLLTRMANELEDASSYRQRDEIVDKYATLAAIQSGVVGSVYTIEDFIEAVEDGTFTPYDGFGTYVDTRHNFSDKTTSFNVKELKKKANEYPYVIWYNR